MEKKVLIELPLETYNRFFVNERIQAIEFPLQKNPDKIGRYITAVDLDVFTMDEIKHTLIKFFSSNIGKKVEVNLRYGLGHLCKEKMTFFVQGDIHSDYIKISSEIELSSPHRSASFWNPLNYNFIVSAKYINS